MRKTYQIGAKVEILKYFCVTPKNGSTEIKLVPQREGQNLTPISIDLEYSIDKVNWSTYTVGNTITTSDPVYFRGNNYQISTSSTGSYVGYVFDFNNTVDLSGQLSSLSHKHITVLKKPLSIEFHSSYIRSIKDLIIDIDVGRVIINNDPISWGDFSCKGMFSKCTNLIDTPQFNLTINDITSQETGELIFKTSVGSLYEGMFNECSNLISIYNLPPLYGINCYKRMFRNCFSLTTAPALTNSAMEPYACQYMFQNCTSLTTAPTLPSTTLAEYCYDNMFYNCNSLTTTPVLPATTLAEGCYSNMFIGCYSLTTLPVLSAPALPDKCYQYMFANINLREISGSRYIFHTPISSNQSSYFANPISINATSVGTDSLYRMFGDTARGGPDLDGTGGYTDWESNSITANTTYYCIIPIIS